MTSYRTPIAVIAGRLAGRLARAFGGGGSALPGLVASRVDPGLWANLVSQIPQGTCLVTGTNGKTTTSHMLAAIARAGGLEPLQNHAGSNLLRGLTATLLEQASLGGRLRATPRSVGVLEVDEAVMPLVTAHTTPRALVVTNLFRDQLDRYGEVDTVRYRWEQAVASLPLETTLVLNADDPAVASLAGAARGPVLFFGVEDTRQARPTPEHAADSRTCSQCGRAFDYEAIHYAHLGHYCCRQCGVRRPATQVSASEIVLDGFNGVQFVLRTPEGQQSIRLKVGGLYNVYNALAAASAGLAIGIPIPTIAKALDAFTPAFGRIERLEIQGRQVCFILVKNPTGFNQVLRTLAQGPLPETVLMVLNDQTADGQDISWIWDVDFDGLDGIRLLVSGLRAEDMALRLKYAGLPVDRGIIERDLAAALDRAVETTPTGGAVYVLPTYTGMLELQRLLARRGQTGAFLGAK